MNMTQAHLPTLNCTGSAVVIFNGIIRGDIKTWQNIFEFLVKPNKADVVMNVWSSDPLLERNLVDVFKPCYYNSYEYSPLSVLNAEPRLNSTAGGRFFIEDEREAGFDYVPQFYNLHRNLEFLKYLPHSVFVRCRLDLIFRSEITLPLAIHSNSIHAALEWGGERYDHGDEPPFCPKMMNDFFAFGDYFGMIAYFSAFDDMIRLHYMMKAMPGYRRVWEVSGNRFPDTFLECAESMLAFRLRASRVTCYNFLTPMCIVRHINGSWMCASNPYHAGNKLFCNSSICF